MKHMSHEQRRQRRKAIARSVKGGLSFADAAREHGVCVGTVYHACSEHGLGGISVRRDRRREMAVAVKGGESPGAVARRFSTGLTSVREACSIYGVPCSDRHRSHYRSYAVLADLINTDTSITDLAAKHRVTSQAISLHYCRAKAAGIKMPIRKRGGNRESS